MSRPLTFRLATLGAILLLGATVWTVPLPAGQSSEFNVAETRPRPPTASPPTIPLAAATAVALWGTERTSRERPPGVTRTAQAQAPMLREREIRRARTGESRSAARRQPRSVQILGFVIRPDTRPHDTRRDRLR